MLHFTDLKVVFGCCALRPIVNHPDGATIRLRLRADSIALAFVKLPGKFITKHYIEVDGDGWRLSEPIAANHHV